MKFNYSLESEDYTWKNALLWGNCTKHFEKASKGLLGSRIIHGIIGIAELMPIVGQVSSTFEMIIVTRLSDRPSTSDSLLYNRYLRYQAMDQNRSVRGRPTFFNSLFRRMQNLFK